jgi:hypothetical protein
MQPGEKNRYRRLGGRGAGAFGLVRHSRCTLWQGPDHLLLVDNHGYTEDYKRFYFADIQAISMVKTVTATIWSAVFGMLTVFGLSLALAGIIFEWPLAANVFDAFLAALFLLCLIVNWARGPTCACTLYTAVQSERLYALSRFRSATRAVRDIRKIVDAVQGGVSEQDVADYVHQAALSRAEAAPDPLEPGDASLPEPVRRSRRRVVQLSPYRSYAHPVMFGVLVLDAVHGMLQFAIRHLAFFALGMGISAGMAVAVVVALIKQQSTDLPFNVKTATWCALAYLFATYIFGTIYSSVFMVSHPELAGNSVKYARAMAAMSPFDSPVRLSMLLVCIACSSSLGIIGLVLVGRHMEKRSMPPRLGREA